jgi:homoserine kinase
MLSKEEETAKETEELMKEVYTRLGIDYKTYVTTINYNGVQLIEE